MSREDTCTAVEATTVHRLPGLKAVGVYFPRGHCICSAVAQACVFLILWESGLGDLHGVCCGLIWQPLGPSSKKAAGWPGVSLLPRVWS